jgi:hypothetical protein
MRAITLSGGIDKDNSDRSSRGTSRYECEAAEKNPGNAKARNADDIANWL